MPALVVFENDRLGVVVTLQGEMDTELFSDQNEQFYTPEILDKLRYQIVDLREVENVDIDLLSIRRLAETDVAMAQAGHGLKIGIVVNRGVMEGLVQIYQRYAKHEKLQTKVFYTLTAARAWVADCVDLEASA